MKDAFITYCSVMFSLMLFSAVAGYQSRDSYQAPEPAELTLSSLQLEKSRREPAAEYIDIMPLPPASALK